MGIDNLYGSTVPIVVAHSMEVNYLSFDFYNNSSFNVLPSIFYIVLDHNRVSFCCNLELNSDVGQKLRHTFREWILLNVFTVSYGML